MRAERRGQRLAEGSAADQHIRVLGDVADLEQRAAFAEKSAHVKYRAQRLLRHAERNHARRMTVHDRIHVGTRTIDLGVDETLEIYAPAGRVEGGPLQVEGDDVCAPHEA